MRLIAIILACPSMVTVVSLARELRACEPVLEESFYAFGGQGDLDGIALSNDNPREGLRELVVRGRGRLAGGGMHLHLLLFERMRVGYDVIAWDVDDAQIDAAGAALDVNHFVGLRDAAFVGVELLQGPVYPYLDLVGSFDVLIADVDVGDLGATLYGDVSLGIGARAGLRVPVTSWLMLDAAGHHRIFGGHVRFSATAGLTITLGSRGDPYANELEERDDT